MQYYQEEFLKTSSVKEIQKKVKCPKASKLVQRLEQYPHSSGVEALVIGGDIGVNVDFFHNEDLFSVIFIVDHPKQEGLLSWFSDLGESSDIELIGRKITPNDLVAFFDATPHIFNYSKSVEKNQVIQAQ